jgi:hypothetical protein
MTDRLHSWRALLASRPETMAKKRMRVGAEKRGVEKEDGRVGRGEMLLPDGECSVAPRV